MERYGLLIETVSCKKRTFDREYVYSVILKIWSKN
jgi:hypothetical protein